MEVVISLTVEDNSTPAQVAYAIEDAEQEARRWLRENNRNLNVDEQIDLAEGLEVCQTAVFYRSA